MSEASKHQRYSAGALSACCNACDATCCPSGTCASIAERSSKSTKNTNPRSAMSLRPSPLHLGSALRILWSWWCDPKAPNCWPRPHHSSLFEMYWPLYLLETLKLLRERQWLVPPLGADGVFRLELVAEIAEALPQEQSPRELLPPSVRAMIQ